jgi:hypothetical protein
MPAKMILHEGGNEVVAMIVPTLAAQLERDICLRTFSFQQVRAKLLIQERIGITNVDQEIRKPRPILNQRDSIMLAPCLLVAAEIASECLDAPWDLRGCDDRRKRTGGAVARGIRKRHSQGAVV